MFSADSERNRSWSPCTCQVVILYKNGDDTTFITIPNPVQDLACRPNDCYCIVEGRKGRSLMILMAAISYWELKYEYSGFFRTVLGFLSNQFQRQGSFLQINHLLFISQPYSLRSVLFWLSCEQIWKQQVLLLSVIPYNLAL